MCPAATALYHASLRELILLIRTETARKPSLLLGLSRPSLVFLPLVPALFVVTLLWHPTRLISFTDLAPTTASLRAARSHARAYSACFSAPFLSGPRGTPRTFWFQALGGPRHLCIRALRTGAVGEANEGTELLPARCCTPPRPAKGKATTEDDRTGSPFTHRPCAR